MANTQQTEKKQSAKQKKILVASILLAAAITVGSTFAWFTSKDEVTNRLSASANYGVAIGENFQPPENWVPGQEINKDASAVNTGNVDAFVRMWMTGEMKVLNTTALLDTNTTRYNEFPANPKASATTDDNLKALNLTGYKTVNNVNYYYKQLSVAQTTNPETNGENNQKDGYQYDGVRGTDAPTNGSSPSTPNSSAYSEVQTIQTGGYLVSAPADAEYEFVTNQETRLPLYFDSTNKAVNINVPAGYLVKVVKNGISSGEFNSTGSADLNVTGTAIRSTNPVPTVYVLAQNTFKPTKVDAETFAPYTAGTYIFARNVDLNDSGTTVTTDNLDNYEFAGYYFDAEYDNGSTAGKGGYWALKNADANGTNRSDYTLPKKYVTKITDSGTESYKGETGTDDSNAVLTLVFDNSGYLSTVTPTNNLEMYTAAYKQIENNALKWVYTAPTVGNDTATLSAIYQGDTDLTETDSTSAADAKLRDDIVIDIKLNNIGNASEQWTEIDNNAANTFKYYTADKNNNGKYDTSSVPTDIAFNQLYTFYYNNDVEAGDSTAKLIDSVTLRNTTKKEAFIAFDFDLNMNLESIQVTFDENGNEQDTPVKPWSASGNVTPAQGTRDTNTTKEIASMTWTKSTP